MDTNTITVVALVLAAAYFAMRTFYLRRELTSQREEFEVIEKGLRREIGSHTSAYGELAESARKRNDAHTTEVAAFRGSVTKLRERGDTYRTALDEILALSGNMIGRAKAAQHIAAQARSATQAE